MDARDLKSREYNTDVFNVRNGYTNGAAGLYDPHPYLRDRDNCETRARTSFQDSNIFSYKEDQNVTWQNQGRADKQGGKKAGAYPLHYHSPDNVIYNPAAGMSESQSTLRGDYVQPDKDAYMHNDPNVPKGRLGEEIYGTKQFNRQAARKDLLPNDDYWLRHTDFERDTVEKQAMRPEERRLRDLYGTYSGQAPPAFEAKPKEFKNETLSNWCDPHKSEKRSNVPQDVNTFQRRAQELSSVNNPLTHTDYSQYIPQNKKQESYEDVEKRVKDAFYSDMYGQTGKFTQKNPVQRSEIHSMTGPLSREGASKGARWGENVTAAQRRQDFMRTTGFGNTYDAPPAQQKYQDPHQMQEAISGIHMPKVIKGSEMNSSALHSDEFNQKYSTIKGHTEANVVDLAFNNLPREMDVETLKKISGAKHVVRAFVQTDNIKNECTGMGEITIRLYEGETKEEFVNKFQSLGFNVIDKPEPGKRKNNYKDLATTGWRDSRLECSEKRHMNTGWENDKISKVKNLATNVPMGTNNDLYNLSNQYTDTIRNRQDGLFNAQRTAEAENNLIYNWNQMRPQTAGPAYTNTAGSTDFGRASGSFNPGQSYY